MHLRYSQTIIVSWFAFIAPPYATHTHAGGEDGNRTWYVDNDDMLDPDANPWHYEGQQKAIAALKKARGEL